MASVLSRFNGAALVHHRALNAHSSLQKTLDAIARHPSRDHVLEGDLCWNFGRGEKLLYFHHPNYVIDALSTGAIGRGLSDGTLVTLADLAPVRNSNASVVIELKVGRGDTGAALDKLIDYLEENFRDRYWVDGFSLSLIERVKRISPQTTVTLHTELVHRERVLVGAPEWPTLRLMKLADLPEIDGIAIRRRGRAARMAKACREVRAANKAVIVSRVANRQDFTAAKSWGACAIYVPSDFESLVESDMLAGAR